jgi:DNA-binding NarL/FixJ family response regulator
MPDFGISQTAAADLVHRLTPRETEIAEALAMGEPRRAIAQRLRLSERTVAVYVERVREKLGATVHGVARVWFAARS